MTRSQGALTVSHRKVWMLAGPIILSNISVPLVGAVDTAVVGHLPEPQSIDGKSWVIFRPGGFHVDPRAVAVILLSRNRSRDSR